MIIPAHDAAATIERALVALSHQDLEAAFEVVVVDDCSTDATASIAERAGASVVRLDSRRGPAAARNAGAAATSAELLAFTDADCEPAAEWLREGIAALERGADLVTGPIEPVHPPGPFDRSLRVDGPSRLFESANLLTRRTLFERLDGFRRPAGLPPQAGHFGEDAVFGWRAVRDGASIAHAPRALVRHAVFARGARAYVAERRRLALFPILVREIPELRSTMFLRTFLSATTASFDLALAGLVCAVATRRREPLVAAAPYAWRRLRGGPPWRPSVVRRNLVFIGADLIGFAALLRGGLRERTPLL